MRQFAETHAPQGAQLERRFAQARRGLLRLRIRLGLTRRGVSSAALTSALSAPMACVIAGTALAFVGTSDRVNSAWLRIGAESFVPVDIKYVDADHLYIRQVGITPLDLESHIAATFTPNPEKLQEELHCLAQNIYFEARNEPLEGKLAVAHVVMNRVASRHYPETVCGVIHDGKEQGLHKCQFSWYCDGKADEMNDARAWEESLHLAGQVFWGSVSDNSGGALWYHADYVKPHWRTAFARGPKYGRHIFYSREAKLAPTQVAQSQ